MLKNILSLFTAVIDNKQNGSYQPSNTTGKVTITTTSDWSIFLIILFVLLSIVLFFCILSLKEKVTELKEKNEKLEKEISELKLMEKLNTPKSKDEDIKTEILNSIETILENHKKDKDS